MNREVKEALSGIKSAWKNMFLARDKEKAHQYYLDNIDKWHQGFAESSWCIENNITEEV